MTARPMTEGERAHAVQLATRIVEDREPLMRAGNTSFDDVVNLARALLSTSAAVRGMREALEKAGKQFRFYEREHQAKADAVYAVSGPRRDEYEKRLAKAKTNKDFADMCIAALSGIEPGEDEQARPSGSAPISTDTKGTTK